MREGAGPRRVAMVSLHTSPLDPPGDGDAGGLNVYVVEVARRLAARGVAVDVFTRRTAAGQPDLVALAPGVHVRHVGTGPYAGLSKEDLAARVWTYAGDVLHGGPDRPRYDLVHSHYWLSGEVGRAAKRCWDVPLVHTMHTMAKVKNLALAAGDDPEPAARVAGEERVVAAADVLLANTDDEARALVLRYGAAPERTAVAHPGVDLDVFRPGPQAAARAALGLAPDAVVLLFVGRLQALKAPDVLVRAAADLLARRPDLRDRLVVPVVGGPSGTRAGQVEGLRDLAAGLGVAGAVRLEPPASRTALARWYRASTVTVVPSYNESFGLVAVESQACGTPVVAAAVGGLTTAVAAGRSGVLVAGHDPAAYSAAIAGLLDDPGRLADLGAGAVRHAAGFSWDRTVERTVAAYALARATYRTTPVAGPGGRACVAPVPGCRQPATHAGP